MSNSIFGEWLGKRVKKFTKSVDGLKRGTRVVLGVGERAFHTVVEGRAKKNEGLAEEVLSIGDTNQANRDQKIYEKEKIIQRLIEELNEEHNVNIDQEINSQEIRNLIIDKEQQENPDKNLLRKLRELLKTIEQKERLLEAKRRYEERRDRIIKTHADAYREKEEKASFEVRKATQELENLKRRGESLAADIEGVKGEIAKLKGEINKLEGILNNYLKPEQTGIFVALTRTFHWLSISQLRGEIQNLKDKIDLLEEKQEKLEDKKDEVTGLVQVHELSLKTLETRLNEIKTKGAKWIKRDSTAKAEAEEEEGGE